MRTADLEDGGITIASPWTMAKVLRVGDSWTYGRTRLTYGPPGVVNVEHLDGEDPGVVLS